MIFEPRRARRRPSWTPLPLRYLHSRTAPSPLVHAVLDHNRVLRAASPLHQVRAPIFLVPHVVNPYS